MPPILDNFNRASLGAAYSSVSNLSIVSNALSVSSGSWGEAYILGNAQALPTVVAYDFWVPASPNSPYRGYQVEAAYINLYPYIDNGTATPATSWRLYMPGGGSVDFPVVASTWYRLKCLFSGNTAGSPFNAKVWAVGDTEPDWLISGTLSTTHASSGEHYIYLDGLGSQIDNLEIYPDSGIETITGSFTADAVLDDFGVDFPAPADRPRLSKSVQMSVLQRRPLVFSAFIPPVTPDEKEEDPPNKPDCLPPCGPQGAGGPMNGWGAFKVSMTKCTECSNYFRSDSEFLGRGAAAMDSAEHCGYCGEHNRDQHVTKLFVNYPNMPDGRFVMRAKMSWDVNGPDTMSVNVYNVDEYPDVEDEGCVDTMDWVGGRHVGRFAFTNDAEIVGYIILGQSQYKYQKEPAEVAMDGNSLGTSIFRFEIADESVYYKAKFRASNLEWPEEQ